MRAMARAISTRSPVLATKERWLHHQAGRAIRGSFAPPRCPRHRRNGVIALPLCASAHQAQRILGQYDGPAGEKLTLRRW